MDLGLGGKVALVTGASKGIGRAVAEGLAAEGARALLGESAAKLAGRRLATLDLTSLGEAAAATRDSVGDDFDWTRVPRFPRRR